MPRHKRPRGGQPGNQNARKHGFYCAALNAKELAEFRDITNKEKLDPQIAVLRVKVVNALAVSPGNRRILVEGAHLVSECFNSQYGLTGKAAVLVRRYWRGILNAAVKEDPELTNQIVSTTLKRAEKLQND
jgi:hypothetical protein